MAAAVNFSVFAAMASLDYAAYASLQLFSSPRSALTPNPSKIYSLLKTAVINYVVLKLKLPGNFSGDVGDL